MQEKIREKLIFAIGVLAFLIAGVSFVFFALDILAVLQALEWNFTLLLQTAGAYELLVDLVFSGLELAMGLILIKQWKEKEKVEVYKTLSRLINAVVYASFMKVIMGLLMGNFTEQQTDGVDVNILYCIIYFAYYIFSFSIGTQLRKRKWMSLYLAMLTTSLLAVGFCIYDCTTVLQAQETAVVIGTTFANTALMGLIVVFAAGVVAYYAKDPSALWRDVLDGEDYDVLGQSNGYEMVRIYAHRAQEGGMNVLIQILYVLSTLVGIAGIIFYGIENNIGQYFGGSVQELIDNVWNGLLEGGVYQMVELMVLLVLVLMYPFIYLAQTTGVFTRKAESKITVMSIAGIGTMLVLMVSLGTIFDIVVNFTNHMSIQWEKYSLFQAGLIILYLVYRFTKRIYKNATKEINDGVMQGDSYHSHSAAVARICLLSGGFSVAGLGLIFAMKAVEDAICLSYLLLAVSILFTVVGACLEAKYPFSEYENAKRKIVATSESGAEQKKTEDGAVI